MLGVEWGGRSKRLAACAVFSAPIVALFPTAALAEPGTVRVEAESLDYPGEWSLDANSGYSAGEALLTNTPGVALSLPLTVVPGESVDVEIHGYRDSTLRRVRLNLDGGPWIDVAVNGASDRQALLATVSGIGEGTHSVNIERTGTQVVGVDFFELVTSGGATTTTATTAAPSGSACVGDGVVCSGVEPDGVVALFFVVALAAGLAGGSALWGRR